MSSENQNMELRQKELESLIYDRIDFSRIPTDEEVRKIIVQVVDEFAFDLSARHRFCLEKRLFYSIRGFDVLSELMEDDMISEIMVNREDQIFVEKNGTLALSQLRFSSQEKLENVIQKIVSGVNRRVNESAPIADARLPDGSRVNIVLPPVSVNGPVITIRKFPKNPLTMRELVLMGCIPKRWADELKHMVVARKNIFISGGTGTGKTTFLNILSQYIPMSERIITIEDSAELQIRDIPNVVTLEARPANLEGENGITIRQLIRTALRMRPDRIVVGEVRGEEVLDMLQAMNTGHAGSLSTGHANSAEDMLRRLELMAILAMNVSLEAVQRQIVSALDILIHLDRDRSGMRRVASIHRLTGVTPDGYQLETLYQWEEEDTSKASG